MYTSLALALVLGAPALKDREPLGKGPGYLGITFQKDEGGLVVTDVKPDSPAAKGGMKVNDLIVKLDGASLVDADTGELVKIVGGMRPGTLVVLEVKRGTETVALKVKLGPRPPDFAPTPQRIPPPGFDDP